MAEHTERSGRHHPGCLGVKKQTEIYRTSRKLEDLFDGLRSEQEDGPPQPGLNQVQTIRGSSPRGEGDREQQQPRNQVQNLVSNLDSNLRSNLRSVSTWVRTLGWSLDLV